MIQRHLLWRLYHITSAINESTRQVEEANEKLEELRTEVVRDPHDSADFQNEDDKKLQSARKDQAQAQLNVKQREIAVKKAEKALEDKVGTSSIVADVRNRSWSPLRRKLSTRASELRMLVHYDRGLRKMRKGRRRAWQHWKRAQRKLPHG